MSWYSVPLEPQTVHISHASRLMSTLLNVIAVSVSSELGSVYSVVMPLPELFKLLLEGVLLLVDGILKILDDDSERFDVVVDVDFVDENVSVDVFDDVIFVDVVFDADEIECGGNGLIGNCDL